MLQRVHGRVVNGHIVLEDDVVIEEGSHVVVLSHDDVTGVNPTPEEEAMIDQAMQHANRGDASELSEVLRRMRAKRCQPDTQSA